MPPSANSLKYALSESYDLISMCKCMFKVPFTDQNVTLTIYYIFVFIKETMSSYINDINEKCFTGSAVQL